MVMEQMLSRVASSNKRSSLLWLAMLSSFTIEAQRLQGACHLSQW